MLFISVSVLITVFLALLFPYFLYSFYCFLIFDQVPHSHAVIYIHTTQTALGHWDHDTQRNLRVIKNRPHKQVLCFSLICSVMIMASGEEKYKIVYWAIYYSYLYLWACLNTQQLPSRRAQVQESHLQWDKEEKRKIQI